MEYWSNGVMEWWSIGVLEYWSIGVVEYWNIGIYGVLGRHLNTPILHYSTTPAPTPRKPPPRIPLLPGHYRASFPFCRGAFG
jgi:hypothetical protein